jgi:hypothetical protein
MPKLTIATIFTETIEKELRNHLPKSAIQCIMLMADQIQQLEQALEVVHNQNLRMMRFITLSEVYKKMVKKGHEDFTKDYEKEFQSVAGSDNTMSERAKKGDIDEM